jgi:hypothetical protein
VRRLRNAGLVLCLFTLYCVLLSQGLKANALSTFFGALAAVPLTVHLYNRVWFGAVPPRQQRDIRQCGDRAMSPAEAEVPSIHLNSADRE